jgi:hypothetical protein
MNSLFQTEPVGADVWLRIFVIALFASVIVGLDKLWRRRCTTERP